MLAMPESLPNADERESSRHHSPTRRWGCGQWLIIAVVVVIGFALLAPLLFVRTAEKSRQMQACNNCRQIIICLKEYASEHEESYPGGATANDVFRELIKAGMLEDEQIFTCPESPYVVDNNIGEAPDFTQAVQAGENHWAMTKGLSYNNNTTNGNCPFVFENPAECTWPPLWLGGQHTAVPGRTWGNKKFPNANGITVGHDDGSVSVEKLMDGKGKVTLEPNSDGKNLFDLAGPHEILDVAK
jgi:hypothetical protein